MVSRIVHVWVIYYFRDYPSPGLVRYTIGKPVPWDFGLVCRFLLL